MQYAYGKMEVSMGHDEDKNNFDTGGASPTPVAPNPRATITSGNRLGMRQSRNVSAAQAELDRISKDSNPNASAPAESGDIVLNNPATKSGKSPKIFILVILIVLALVAFLVSLIITKGKIIPGVGGKEDNKDRIAYLKILQYGDAESEKDFDKELALDKSALYQKTIDEVSIVERGAYSNKLLEAYKKYKSDSDSVRKLLESYNSYMNLEAELNEIENVYLKDGEKAARERFASEKVETEEDSDGIIKPLTNAEYLTRLVYEYKSAYVSELAAYSAMGCIKGGTKNEGCIEVMRSNVTRYPDFMEVESSMFSINNSIDDYAENAMKQLYKESISGE